MTQPGLRDLKREATSRALANAALELAIEQGMDGFIVDEVAQRAGFSRRTFANHFACKEEAVAHAAILINTELEPEAEQLLDNNRDNVTLLELLQQLLQMQLTAELFGRMRLVLRLSQTHPTLEPYILSAFRQLQTSAFEWLRQVAPERYSEAYVHMLIGAVYGAVFPVLEGSLAVRLHESTAGEETDAAVPFEQYLETVFGYLRHGF
ncbi:hypothetical protein PA598K_01771 [Paenibacillus sp. 598K]|uniref:TetR/AcrR family transcriptional regulator n=1 Tax=Paenibacillus sp. 598K TaxID=1117987 RepID=UPI000FF9C3E5|nr:TetR family transcriptional regulator [Paenibacillus sp. 598K]GBF73480.1 hypothetical protein PA598K_01771 [Paenibacillus sp. 598K]